MIPVLVGKELFITIGLGLSVLFTGLGGVNLANQINNLSEPQFHENTNDMFKPFLEYIKHHPEQKELIDDYMYMYHDKEGNYFYKHSGYRDYVVINKDGKIEKGKLH